MRKLKPSVIWDTDCKLKKRAKLKYCHTSWFSHLLNKLIITSHLPVKQNIMQFNSECSQVSRFS